MKTNKQTKKTTPTTQMCNIYIYLFMYIYTCTLFNCQRIFFEKIFLRLSFYFFDLCMMMMKMPTFLAFFGVTIDRYILFTIVSWGKKEVFFRLNTLLDIFPFFFIIHVMFLVNYFIILLLFYSFNLFF